MQEYGLGIVLAVGAATGGRSCRGQIHCRRADRSRPGTRVRRTEKAMKIYVDGDACPVKEQIYRVAARYGVPVLVVANSVFRVPSQEGVEFMHVPGGFEAVDDWIAEQVSAGDLVT